MSARNQIRLSRLIIQWLLVPAIGLCIGLSIGSISVMAIDVMSNFDMADKNHDSRISRDEFEGLTETIPVLMGCFDEMDRNNDGYITRDEWSLTPDGRDTGCPASNSNR